MRVEHTVNVLMQLSEADISLVVLAMEVLVLTVVTEA